MIFKSNKLKGKDEYSNLPVTQVFVIVDDVVDHLVGGRAEVFSVHLRACS